MGCSISHTEDVLSRWSPAGHVQVAVAREATLSPDLTRVENRRVRSIRVIVGDTTMHLQIEQARLLSEGLMLALEAAWQGPLGDVDDEESA